MESSYYNNPAINAYFQSQRNPEKERERELDLQDRQRYFQLKRDIALSHQQDREEFERAAKIKRPNYQN